MTENLIAKFPKNEKQTQKTDQKIKINSVNSAEFRQKRGSKMFKTC